MKNIFRFHVLLTIFVFIFSVSSSAQEVNDKLNISGFGIFHYLQTDKKDAVEVVEFHPIYMNFNIQANEKTKTMLEIEYEHLPSQDNGGTKNGEIKVERAYIEFNHNDKVNLQAGKFFVPAGLWLPIHWRLLTPTYDRVIYIQNKNDFIPSHQVGLHYFGNFSMAGSLEINYNLWLTLGDADSNTDKATTEFNNLGGNLKLSPMSFIDIGAAFQNIETTAGSTKDHDSVLYFAHFHLLDDNLTVSTEYITSYQNATHSDPKTYRDLTDWYTGIEYHFSDDWSVYYRYDIGDDAKRSGNASESTKDPETKINSAALTWTPLYGSQIRFEYIMYDFTDKGVEDYNSYQISYGQFF